MLFSVFKSMAFNSGLCLPVIDDSQVKRDAEMNQKEEQALQTLITRIGSFKTDMLTSLENNVRLVHDITARHLPLSREPISHVVDSILAAVKAIPRPDLSALPIIQTSQESLKSKMDDVAKKASNRCV